MGPEAHGLMLENSKHGAGVMPRIMAGMGRGQCQGGNGGHTGMCGNADAQRLGCAAEWTHGECVAEQSQDGRARPRVAAGAKPEAERGLYDVVIQAWMVWTRPERMPVIVGMDRAKAHRCWSMEPRLWIWEQWQWQVHAARSSGQGRRYICWCTC